MTTPEAHTAEIDITFLDDLVGRLGTGRENLIPLLQAVQRKFRYLPRPALDRIVESTRITAADLTGVATFYSQFRLRPVGEHVISVCHGTACHVKGAPAVTDALFRELRIPHDNDTAPDGRFTVEKVACIGCCTLAPAMQIDGIVYGHLNPRNVMNSVADFLTLKERGVLSQPRERPGENPHGLAEIRIALDSCCVAGGTRQVYDAFEDAIRRTGVPAVVKRVGCISMCHQVPVVEVAVPGREPAMYAKVRPDDVRDILLRHLDPPSPLARVSLAVSRTLERVLTDESWEPVTRYAVDVRDEPICTFIGPQKHIAIEGVGRSDPVSIDDYIAGGGFEALRRCVGGLDPQEIIERVNNAGLRGRGGAGFPTGLKWEIASVAEGRPKYVVCNGDEGDPGAFMDRMLLESCPYRVLEGIAIGAYAVGASEGVIYVRAEYPFAVRRLTEAIACCEERGFLGDRIAGSEFSLRLRIMEGAGAFVCGEETALLASIEGRRGMPRLRPPYPSQSGLWGKPTLINNVETFSLVPWIIRNGADAFAQLGTPESRGTKVFALAGKVRRGGLIEVPMGVTIRQIVEEMGGGIAGERQFKAVQIGGPSGGCVPAALADTPIDYEDLTTVGAIMGSGGLVVLADDDCMVDVARYFLEFTQGESCGKCSFCRIGTRRMLDILERLCHGEGRNGDIERLEELCHQVAAGSLCGLGATAPNPVLTTLRYFRDEYEAHLTGRCPAGRCKSLIRYTVTDDCIGCTRCAQVCPADAIEMRPLEKHEIDDEKCVRCDGCRGACPVGAVVVE
jgi:NADH:ubiquinone oxidoreductase subunit F (NADH-binding)/NADH:ubiquinone oxidoreductase subunit E/(2Fe-2S) ferredoxin